MLKKKNAMPDKLIVACVIAMLFISQAALAANKRVLYKGKVDYVRIDEQDDQNIPNDHPFPISAKELVELLSPLTYKKKSFMNLGSGNEPIFERRQLEKLSGHLSQGLKVAGRNQDIIFAMSGNKKEFIGTTSLVTSGRVFVKDGHLNIIFGRIDLDYDAYINERDHYAYIERQRAGENTELYRVLTAKVMRAFPVEPGNRKNDAAQESVKIGSRGGRPMQARRDGWVMISLPERKGSDLAEIEKIRQTRSEADSIRARHEGKFREQPGQQVYQARPAYKDTMTIDERLSKLKELLEKGLIDEATYQKKRDQILSEL